MTDNLGMLFLTTQEISTGNGYYRQIVDAKWQGPPLTLLGDYELYMLPDWAYALEGDLVQMGPYVLRSTRIRHFAMSATYYYLVDGGEVYVLWWRLCQSLDLVWRRFILILAVWGLACWPREGAIPGWQDVVRRWKK